MAGDKDIRKPGKRLLSFAVSGALLMSGGSVLACGGEQEPHVNEPAPHRMNEPAPDPEPVEPTTEETVEPEGTDTMNEPAPEPEAEPSE